MSFGNRSFGGNRSIESGTLLERGGRDFLNSSGHSRKRRWILLGLLILLLVVFLGAYSYYRSQVDGGSSNQKVTLTVSSGEGLSQFATLLALKKVIGSSLIFKIWLHTQPTVLLRTGSYAFVKDESFHKVITTLTKGPLLDKLTVPDGLTLAQIAVRVGKIPGHSAAGFLKVAESGQVRSPFEPKGVNSLEGLLYPDTYSFDPSTSNRAILQLMVNSFDSHAKAIGLTPETVSNGLTGYQIVTMASIIEKEALYPGDGNKVARVILNRLASHMKLQLDSTVFYALGNNVSHLSLADLQVNSPYNTYLHHGLPPTPISIPSQAALEDALHPATGNWLYYVVVQPNGKEAFSSTYAGQLANEKLAQSRGLG